MSVVDHSRILIEASAKWVGIRAISFVGKIQARNYKPDQAGDGAIVSIGVHAFWCGCGEI